MGKLINAGLKDVLTLVNIPTNSIDAFIDKKKTTFQEILLTEIRQGNLKLVEQEELISVFFRFQNSVIEGTARKNLHLLAIIINGMAEKNELKANNFNKYVNVLSDLSEDEITTLGIMAKHHPPGPNRYTHLRDKEITNVVGIKSELLQQALIRTGLVSQSVTSEADADPMFDSNDIEVRNKNHYELTPLMDEILKYTDAINLYSNNP